jgi:hypothetical protein
MASYSEVKAGLDDIAEIIRSQRAVLSKAVSNSQLASDGLAALPTDYADVLATINGYGTSNASEALAKADLAKLTTEFLALKAVADAIAAADVG